MKNRILLFGLLSLFSMSFLTSCDNDQWDKHYDTSANRNESVRNTLMGLKEKGYTKYVEALEKLELDQVLNSGMNFTFFLLNNEAFTAATAGKSDDELKRMILNHIFFEDMKAADFKDTLYTGMAGERLCIWMDRLEMANYHNQKVNIIKTDIDIPAGTIFELDQFVIMHPFIEDVLAAEVPLFYNTFEKRLKTDSVNYIVDQVLSSEGYFIDTTYVRKFVESGNIFERTTILAQSDEFLIDDSQNQLNKILPYVGNVEEYATDIYMSTSVKLSMDKQLYNKWNQNIDYSWDLFTESGEQIHLNVDAIKEIQLFSNGNQIVYCDTMLTPDWTLSESLRMPKFRTKQIFRKDNAKFTFEGGFNSFGDWKDNTCVNIHRNKIALGDYMQVNIDADELCTGTYEVLYLYHDKGRFVDLDFSFDGESIGIVDQTIGDNIVGDRGDWLYGIWLGNRTIEAKLDDVVITEYNKEHKLRLTICGGLDRSSHHEIMMPQSIVFRLKQ